MLPDCGSHNKEKNDGADCIQSAPLSFKYKPIFPDKIKRKRIPSQRIRPDTEIHSASAGSNLGALMTDLRKICTILFYSVSHHLSYWGKDFCLSFFVLLTHFLTTRWRGCAVSALACGDDTRTLRAPSRLFRLGFGPTGRRIGDLGWPTVLGVRASVFGRCVEVLQTNQIDAACYAMVSATLQSMRQLWQVLGELPVYSKLLMGDYWITALIPYLRRHPS